jgi:hypothetical protein
MSFLSISVISKYRIKIAAIVCQPKRAAKLVMNASVWLWISVFIEKIIKQLMLLASLINIQHCIF